MVLVLSLFALVSGDVKNVLAETDVCCLYYSGSGKSNSCSAYISATVTALDLEGMALGEIAGGEPTTFACSQYNYLTKVISNFAWTEGEPGDYDLNESIDVPTVVAAINLAGGYYGKISDTDYSEGKSCFFAKGYTPVLITELGTKYNKELCDFAEKKAANNPEFTDVLNKDVSVEVEKVKAGYNYLVDLSKKICCVPKKITAGSSCFLPKIKSEIENQYNAYVGNTSLPKPLSGFSSLTPSTVKPEDEQLASYFTCEGSAGAAWETGYFLSGLSCNAIATQDLANYGWLDWEGGKNTCKQEKYYCLCKKDHSVCEDKAYPYLDKTLDDTTKPQGCNFDLAGKTGKDGADSWICEWVSAPANLSPTANACAHLVQPKIEKENYDSFPLELAAIQAMGLKLKKTSADSVQDLVGKVLKAFMGVLGSIALGMFVYGGFLIMSSAGSSEKSEKGTQILVWSALGVIMILSAYMLVKFVLEIIG